MSDMDPIVVGWHETNGDCRHLNPALDEGFCCVCDRGEPCDYAYVAARADQGLCTSTAIVRADAYGYCSQAAWGDTDKCEGHHVEAHEDAREQAQIARTDARADR